MYLEQNQNWDSSNAFTIRDLLPHILIPPPRPGRQTPAGRIHSIESPSDSDLNNRIINMKVFIIAIATLLTVGCATGQPQVEKDIDRDQVDLTQEEIEDLLAAIDRTERSNMTERFECRGLADEEDAPVQVVAEVMEYTDEVSTEFFGVITAAGIGNVGAYKVAGFERRWDFGGDDYGYDYTFIIDIDSEGRYYDFTDVEEGETAPATKAFKCTLVSPEAN
jgi:hypothetical protein